MPQVCNVFCLWQRRWLLLSMHLSWIMEVHIMTARSLLSNFCSGARSIFTILSLRAGYYLFTFMLLVFSFYLGILPITFLSIFTRTSPRSRTLRFLVGLNLLFLQSRLVFFSAIILIVFICSMLGTSLCIDLCRIFNCCRI